MVLRSLIVGAALVASVGGYAQNLAGKWNGRITIEATLPKEATAEQRKMADQMMDAMRKTKLTLDLAAGGTFTLVSTGGPQNQTTRTSGKFKVASGVVTLTPEKANGKDIPEQGRQPIQMRIEQSGRRLNAIVPSNAQAKMTLVFTRA